MATDEQIEDWKYWLDETGHHMLSVSDFGWWACKACNQRGDDWSDPNDFKCIEVDTYEI